MHMQKLMAPVYMSLACFVCLFLVFVVVPLVMPDSFAAWPGRTFEEWISNYSGFGKFVVFMVVFVCVCQGFRALVVMMEENRQRIMFPWQPEYKEAMARRKAHIERLQRAARDGGGMVPVDDDFDGDGSTGSGDVDPERGVEMRRHGKDKGGKGGSGVGTGRFRASRVVRNEEAEPLMRKPAAGLGAELETPDRRHAV